MNALPTEWTGKGLRQPAAEFTTESREEAEAVLEAARRENCRLVGLSALMTTTVGFMEETIKLIHAELPGCKVMVGGAVLTAEYAAEIHADFYSRDAMGSVRIAEEMFA